MYPRFSHIIMNKMDTNSHILPYIMDIFSLAILS